MRKLSGDACPFWNEDASVKLKYLATGAIFANFMLLCAAIPELWALAGIYSLPALLIEHLFHLHNYLVFNNGGILIPQKLGFLIVIPFWSIVGACIGSLVLRRQTKMGQTNLSLFQMVNKIGGLLLAAVFIGYIIFMFFAMLVYN
jgi:hypothetical protein